MAITFEAVQHTILVQFVRCGTVSVVVMLAVFLILHFMYPNKNIFAPGGGFRLVEV